MKTPAIVLSFLILFASSCSKKTSVNKTATTAKETVTPVNTQQASAALAVIADTAVKANTVRFIVSFYSRGEGTEGEQITRFETFIEQFKRDKNKAIAFDKVGWGREGEVDYCLPLTELSATEQVEFIRLAKGALSKAQWVHYMENAACRKRR